MTLIYIIIITSSIFLLFPQYINSKIFYIDSVSGTTELNNNGLDISQPLKTIHQLLQHTWNFLQQGDQILLKRGSIFRELFEINSTNYPKTIEKKGDYAYYNYEKSFDILIKKYLYIGSYGDSNEKKPIISGCNMMKKGEWIGPNSYGEYTYQDEGFPFPGRVEVVIKDEKYLKRGVRDNLNENEFDVYNGFVYYKPPNGHHPDEYEIEYGSRNSGIMINSVNNIVVDGIYVTCSNAYHTIDGGGMFITGASENVYVKNCDFVQNYRYGAIIQPVNSKGGKYIVFENCLASESGQAAFGVKGYELGTCTHVIFDKCVASNIGNKDRLDYNTRTYDREAIGVAGDSISIKNSEIFLSGIDFVFDNDGNKTAFNGGLGVFFYGCSNCLIENSYLHDNGKVAIRSAPTLDNHCENLIIRGNVIINNGWMSQKPNDDAKYGGIVITPYASLVKSHDGMIISNNYIYNNTQKSIIGSRNGGIAFVWSYKQKFLSQIRIEYNVLSNNIPYDSQFSDIYHETNVDFYNNNIYQNRTGTIMRINSDNFDYKTFKDIPSKYPQSSAYSYVENLVYGRIQFKSPATLY